MRCLRTSCFVVRTSPVLNYFFICIIMIGLIIIYIICTADATRLPQTVICHGTCLFCSFPLPVISSPMSFLFPRYPKKRLSKAVTDGSGEVGRASVVLSRDGAVVLGDDVAGRDGVAVSDVAAGVEGVPDGEVQATVGSLGSGPCEGYVAWAVPFCDVGKDVGTLEESTAVVYGEVGLSGDGKVVPGYCMLVFYHSNFQKMVVSLTRT